MQFLQHGELEEEVLEAILALKHRLLSFPGARPRFLDLSRSSNV